MKEPEVVKTKAQQVDEAIARWRRLVDGNAAVMTPATVHSEMFNVILRDNAVLIEELARVRQELVDLKSQRRLETVRELETQFPRKGRRRVTRLTG